MAQKTHARACLPGCHLRSAWSYRSARRVHAARYRCTDVTLGLRWSSTGVRRWGQTAPYIRRLRSSCLLSSALMGHGEERGDPERRSREESQQIRDVFVIKQQQIRRYTVQNKSIGTKYTFRTAVKDPLQ